MPCRCVTITLDVVQHLAYLGRSQRSRWLRVRWNPCDEGCDVANDMALAHLLFQDRAQQGEHVVDGAWLPRFTSLSRRGLFSACPQGRYEIVDMPFRQVLHRDVAEVDYYRRERRAMA